ncbi:VanZ family protein [Colwellia echini]|uniref:VanZ family protein n=1 Tax=Colwellia echini TaxID=1982103 RepID=A0ABY3MZB7_9GAMM|nr:VanZ family protein [Colwellia echini]TYK66575.1 VanZ family protein [Colwellia echini]
MINIIKNYWLFITLALMATIATLSLWPVASLPQVPGSDKTHHFIAYGALMFPAALARPKYWLWLVVVFACFSGVIELIQPYVNRWGEWLDMAANVSGLGCGIILAKIVEVFSLRKER